MAGFWYLSLPVLSLPSNPNRLPLSTPPLLPPNTRESSQRETEDWVQGPFLAKMAAIAEISSLQEWEEEWKVLEEEAQKFKV